MYNLEVKESPRGNLDAATDTRQAIPQYMKQRHLFTSISISDNERPSATEIMAAEDSRGATADAAYSTQPPALCDSRTDAALGQKLAEFVTEKYLTNAT
ncbi:hypothetical protein EVAR_81968_1 [Eumeta japonica]|uniref:Uncharacterized protein n=1 Tax=Eumeta variegata TaxID=151549 RepID=A0A4C1VTS6_EUMVA|nr:hypothetical protein EVAR_81968_1 [Eumeta japonica]